MNNIMYIAQVYIFVWILRTQGLWKKACSEEFSTPAFFIDTLKPLDVWIWSV